MPFINLDYLNGEYECYNNNSTEKNSNNSYYPL